MNNDKLDAILGALENAVALDVAHRQSGSRSGRSPKSTHAEAKQQLIQWRNDSLLKLLQDETTPEAFKDWANYTAESPTVREHYRNELRAELRKKVEE